MCELGRCTWRLRSSKFGDALGGPDRVEHRDALGGCDQASLEMHLEAGIEYLRDTLGGQNQVELRNALGGHDRASLEMHLEAMIV